MGVVRPSSTRSLLLAYHGEDECRSALAAVRWPDGFRCPACGSERAGRVSAIKRWLLATYNKPPTPENLNLYLAEFCFRGEFRDPSAAFEALPATQ